MGSPLALSEKEKEGKVDAKKKNRRRKEEKGKGCRQREREQDETTAAAAPHPPLLGSVAVASRRGSNQRGQAEPEQLALLQHVPPCPVYASKFFWLGRGRAGAGAGAAPGSGAATSCVILSGARDGTIRLWNPATGEAHGAADTRGKLDQGRAHHKASINALAVDPLRSRIYSGDANGTVLIWTVARTNAAVSLWVRAPPPRRAIAS